MLLADAPTVPRVGLEPPRPKTPFGQRVALRAGDDGSTNVAVQLTAFDDVHDSTFSRIVFSYGSGKKTPGRRTGFSNISLLSVNVDLILLFASCAWVGKKDPRKENWVLEHFCSLIISP